ncbi:MAG TPA: CapA family protein, partial [Candidatus Paceibacterota bacterium]|nr:CapA family protein [Candidatus Paceibacterota bacterium]
MKKNNNFLIIILGLMTVILAGLISLKIITTRQDEWSVRDEPRQEKTKDNGPVITKVYFVGDMMLARGVESSVNKNFGGDFSELFKNVPELKEADILFGNLEGPISNNGNNVGSIYSFRHKLLILPALKKAGFDVLSFANNHIGDWNVKAFNDTLTHLKDYDILVTGAGENKVVAETPAIIEKNDIRFGFIGFSDVGPNWMEATEERSGILLASDPNY